jgi:hypothetical protein
MNRGVLRFAFFLLLLAGSFLCALDAARAAGVQVAKQLALMSSDSRQIVGPYGSSNGAMVGGFKKADINKFLMIGVGPESVSSSYQSAVSYTGQYPEDACRLENMPAQARVPAQEKRGLNYQRQVRVVSQCIQMKVKDIGAPHLELPHEQPNCVVQSIDQTTAIGQGGYCFFGILPGSAFEVQFQVNPECSSPQFLDQHQITPQDFFAGVGFYVAGNASGYSMDLEMLEGTRVRMTLEPSGEIFPVSLNYGNNGPLWPLRISPDIHIGNLRVLPAPPGASDQAPVVDSSIYVQNVCPSQCRLGMCESECDYAAAVGAQMRLYHLQRDGRQRLLDVWYGGGVAPAQWAGMIPSSRKLNYGSMSYGERYRVVANLDYPGIYYQLLVGDFAQNLIDLKKFSLSAQQNGRTLPTLSGLSGKGMGMPSLPSIGSMPTLDGGAVNLGSPFQDALTTLQNMFKVPDWPPYYEQFCVDSARCLSLRSGSARSEVGIDFELVGLNENGEAALQNLVAWRQSDLMSTYQQQLPSPPQVRCGW